MKGSEEKFVFFMKGSDRHFIIPVYQRNYDWRLENCKQLYNDLVKRIFPLTSLEVLFHIIREAMMSI